MTTSVPASPRVQAARKTGFFLSRSWSAAALALLLAGCGGGGGGGSIDSSASVPPPAPAAYAIAGTLGGVNAPGLVLRNNGGDDLAIAAHANSFQFPTPVAAGGSYAVTVQAQPAGLTCSVSRGAGGPVNTPITDVSVTCNAITHSVGGAVTGLSTAGLVLRNNGGDDLAVPANASAFQFATPVAAGGGYNVTVLTQPTGLTCTVNGGAGAPINADINTVQVVCSTSVLSVGGTVAGLTGSGLVLQNNGADNLAVAASATRFEFPTPVAYGSAYHVTVLTQPTGQVCTVSSGSGAATTPIGDVAVTCANIPAYTVTSSAGANGSLSPSGTQTVNIGGDITFTATPDSGYAVNQWLLDGALAQTGGSLYQLTNISANHTVSVSFGVVTLTPSVSSLALSVNDTATNAALTGNARQVTFTNSGSLDAINVAINSSGLPSGTAITSDTCSGTLAAGSSCTVTITPGTTATSNCTTGTAPTAATLTASADNVGDTEVDVLVLGYGCIHQGGYLFAVDDTTSNAGSIGGKVWSTGDQSNNIAWSTDGAGVVDYTAILGIDQTSTTGAPSPTAPAYPAGTPPFTACNGAMDGACNTANILGYYNFNRAAGGPAPTPLAAYAAGACSATLSGYSDWYLPAICELSYDAGVGCGSAVQNVRSSLIDSGILPTIGHHWSSTQYSVSSHQAWIAFLTWGSGSFVTPAFKNMSMVRARCTRALTP